MCSCGVSQTKTKQHFKLIEIEGGGGCVDTRSGYMRYVPVISADVPCTYYVHRDMYIQANLEMHVRSARMHEHDLGLTMISKH